MNKKKKIIIATLIILLFIFLFTNIEQIPCQVKCRYQYPPTPPRADGSIMPGEGADYMYCVDECVGKQGIVNCHYKYNGPSGPYCGNNRMDIIEITLYDMLRLH